MCLLACRKKVCKMLMAYLVNKLWWFLLPKSVESWVRFCLSMDTCVFSAITKLMIPKGETILQIFSVWKAEVLGPIINPHLTSMKRGIFKIWKKVKDLMRFQHLHFHSKANTLCMVAVKLAHWSHLGSALPGLWLYNNIMKFSCRLNEFMEDS